MTSSLPSDPSALLNLELFLIWRSFGASMHWTAGSWPCFSGIKCFNMARFPGVSSQFKKHSTPTFSLSLLTINTEFETKTYTHCQYHLVPMKLSEHRMMARLPSQELFEFGSKLKISGCYDSFISAWSPELYCSHTMKFSSQTTSFLLIHCDSHSK